jgi:outer membrane protein assembly factor BamB
VTATFFPAQGSSGGGIWGWGGASIDPATNNVFVATGNSSGSSQTVGYSEQIIELSADLSTVIAHNHPSLPGSADADFGATPLLFQPPGCPPLLAAVNKSGAFVLYNRNNISAGPVQTILMSIATSKADFVGVPSYDPVTHYVYVGLPSTFGIYKPGAGAFSINANCTLNTTPVWNAVFGPDGAASGAGVTLRSPITIANGVAYVSDYTGKTMHALDAATGAQLWSAALTNIGMVGPVVVNGRVYVGDYGGTIQAFSP